MLETQPEYNADGATLLKQNPAPDARAAAIGEYAQARRALSADPDSRDKWKAARDKLAELRELEDPADSQAAPADGDPITPDWFKRHTDELQDLEPLPADSLDFEQSPPPSRKWLIDQWLPSDRVALFTGEGGVGKSRLSLQMAAALAAGSAKDWLPHQHASTIEAGHIHRSVPVVYASYEDERHEAARRLRNLHDKGGLVYCAPTQRQDRLHYLDLAGRGPLWGPVEGKHVSTRAAMLPTGDKLRRYAASVGARLLVIDPLAAAYGSNENDRAAVREFMASWDAWAREHGCAVLFIAHPPKATEKARPAVYSGSTDWRNAARTVWTLAKCEAEKCCKGKLKLTVDKASYSGQRASRHVRDDWNRGGRWAKFDPSRDPSGESNGDDDIAMPEDF